MNLTLPHPRSLPNHSAVDTVSHFVSARFFSHLGTFENPIRCILNTNIQSRKSHSFQNYHYKDLPFFSYTVPALLLNGESYVVGWLVHLRRFFFKPFVTTQPICGSTKPTFSVVLSFDSLLGEGSEKPQLYSQIPE